MDNSLVYMFGRVVRMGVSFEPSELSYDWLINSRAKHVVSVAGVFTRVNF
jgi:hypothetical protein